MAHFFCLACNNFKLLCIFSCKLQSHILPGNTGYLIFHSASSFVLCFFKYSNFSYESGDYNTKAVYFIGKIEVFFSEFKWAFITYTDVLQWINCNSWRFRWCLQFWDRFSSLFFFLIEADFLFNFFFKQRWQYGNS